MNNKDSVIDAGELDITFGEQGKTVLKFPDSTQVICSAIAYGREGALYAGCTVDKMVDGRRIVHFGLVRLLENGSIDRTFGIDGYATGRYGQSLVSSYTSNVVPLEDGRILLGGATHDAIYLARLDSNGQLDTSFGVNGSVVYYLSYRTADLSIHCVPEQQRAPDEVKETGITSSTLNVRSDGSVVACLVGGLEGIEYSVIVKLTNTGAFDRDFGDNGVVFVTEPKQTSLRGVTLQRDEKCLGFGSVSEGAGTTGIFVRYNSTGKVDESFGEGGHARVELPPPDSALSTLLLNGVQGADDKVLGIGVAGGLGASRSMLVCLTGEGKVDESFNLGHPVLFEVSIHLSSFESLAVDGFGRILLVGWLQERPSGLTGFLAVRYLESGELDPAFGNGDGWVQYRLIEGRGTTAYSVVIQSDGNIVVGGSLVDDGFVARLLG